MASHLAGRAIPGEMASPTEASPTDMYRIFIVDDHPMVREGLAGRIAAQQDMTVCGEAADVNDALPQIDAQRPHLAVVDISLRNSDGLELIKRLSDRGRDRLKILVHSMHDEGLYADRCLRAGAMGYISKDESPAEVIHAIRTVLAGKVYVSVKMQQQMLARRVGRQAARMDPLETLTNRELEVFRLIGEGLTTANIARRLSRSIHTIESHRENIKRKLEVDSVAELTRRAVQYMLENS